MRTTRRQFIKTSASAVTLSMVMPKIILGQSPVTLNRRIFVMIQMEGANDGLNTIIPYSNSRYISLRPFLHFKPEEMVNNGVSTVINNDFGFHPSLVELKGFWDAGKVAAVLGVGYPSANLSHFSSTDIWMSADPTQRTGTGWIGRYADTALVGKSGLSAISFGSVLPRVMFANKVVVPNIAPSNNANNLFSNYTYQTDGRYTGDRNNQLNTFKANSTRAFDVGSFVEAIADAGMEAESGAGTLANVVNTYQSSVTYPAGNPLSNPLKMVAQVVTTIGDANIFHVRYGGFDNHSQQIGTTADQFTNKAIGAHANLLRFLSQGVKAFLDDMAEHGLADNVVVLTYSEFGRRPNENASKGTDHGEASELFVIGNAIKGGFFGAQPSLEATALSRAGNPVFTTDFRQVYAEILDKWLPNGDSPGVLNSTFNHLGFL
ncbi:MAG: DUF1501 domain-containing protein [Acidobacteriota bacterium]